MQIGKSFLKITVSGQRHLQTLCQNEDISTALPLLAVFKGQTYVSACIFDKLPWTQNKVGRHYVSGESIICDGDKVGS